VGSMGHVTLLTKDLVVSKLLHFSTTNSKGSLALLPGRNFSSTASSIYLENLCLRTRWFIVEPVHD